MKGFRSILNAQGVARLYLENNPIEGIREMAGVSDELTKFAFALALRGVHPNSLSSISDSVEDQVRILLADKKTTQGLKDEFDRFRIAWRRLYDRERERREAIWRLEPVEPGSKAAEPLLEALAAIANADEADPIGEAHALGIDEVVAMVPVTSAPGSIDYVGFDDIPEPWCERFLQASAGSTASILGSYAGDWMKFVRCWKEEMAMIAKHELAKRNSL
ncbi:hypothetical protein ACU5P1_17030 [Pseudomonas plecoglossicida]|nr:hypothetical protein [Pseudomonas plecoglossicida]EPB94433.1 hypothetical protein L321_18857 [Pseudomonas plecoglossicida NB2011]QLB56368.1 hypothetical protein HAV28_16860 [Pseudomonas plecoglossicida]